MARSNLHSSLCLAALLLAGCTQWHPYYRAQVVRPAEGARVSSSTRFLSPFSFTTTQLARVDHAQVFNRSGWTLVDPGPHRLTVQFTNHRFLPPDYAATVEMEAALEAGHRYTLRSAATNDSVTVWLEDSRTKTYIHSSSVPREALPIVWVDPLSCALLMFGLW